MNYLEHILSADRILIPLIKLNKIIFIGIAQQIQRTEIDGRTRLDLIALLIRAVIVLRKDVQISMYTLRFLIGNRLKHRFGLCCGSRLGRLCGSFGGGRCRRYDSSFVRPALLARAAGHAEYRTGSDKKQYDR